MSWRSKQTEVVQDESATPDDALAQRLSELTHREVALRRITEVVEKQRTLLEERERALASSTSAALTDSEKKLAEALRRAEQAESRVRELEGRVAKAEARPEPKAVAVPAAKPAAPPPVAPPPAAPSAAPQARAVDPEATEAPYTLQRLERLVHEAQLRGDPQAEEMATYLPLLREHAEPDGRLPAQFAPLVDSIFA
jgi:hypothetical protein